MSKKELIKEIRKNQKLFLSSEEKSKSFLKGYIYGLLYGLKDYDIKDLPKDIIENM